MSARKPHPPAMTPAKTVAAPSRTRKKPRGPRVRMTHFEIRRGESLVLRIAVADDALAEVGDELGALVKRIAPSTQTAIVEPTTEVAAVPEPDFVFTRQHVEHDAAYHAELHGHLVDLFSSLCDSALDDALDVARQERDRRADGAN